MSSNENKNKKQSRLHRLFGRNVNLPAAHKLTAADLADEADDAIEAEDSATQDEIDGIFSRIAEMIGDSAQDVAEPAEDTDNPCRAGVQLSGTPDILSVRVGEPLLPPSNDFAEATAEPAEETAEENDNPVEEIVANEEIAEANAEQTSMGNEPEKPSPTGKGDREAVEGVPLAADPIPTAEEKEDTDNPTEEIDDVAEERRESSPRPTENEEIVANEEIADEIVVAEETAEETDNPTEETDDVTEETDNPTEEIVANEEIADEIVVAEETAEENDNPVEEIVANEEIAEANAEQTSMGNEPEKPSPTGKGDREAVEGVPLAADPIPTAEEKEDTDNPTEEPCEETPIVEETDNLQGSLREAYPAGEVAGFALAKTEGALRQNDLQRDIFSESDNSACSFRLPAAATSLPDGGKDAEETDNPSVAYNGDSSIESEANMTSACRLPFFTREPTKEDDLSTDGDVAPQGAEPEKPSPTGKGDREAVEGVPLSVDPIPTAEEKEDTDNPTEEIDDVAEERRESSPRPTENDEIVVAEETTDETDDVAEERREQGFPNANAESIGGSRELSPRPTENDDIVPPVGVANGVESVGSATDSLSKSAIAAYLSATYGEDVAVNVRDDFNSTGLKLADTHFLLVQMQDGEKVARKKQFCIVYVYHTQPDLTIVLLHLTPEAAENLNAQGITVFESKFPRTTFGAWYELDVTPDTPDETVYTALDAAVVACGGPIVVRQKPDDNVAATEEKEETDNPQGSLGEGAGTCSVTEGVPLSGNEPEKPSPTGKGDRETVEGVPLAADPIPTAEEKEDTDNPNEEIDDVAEERRESSPRPTENEEIVVTEEKEETDNSTDEITEANAAETPIVEETDNPIEDTDNSTDTTVEPAEDTDNPCRAGVQLSGTPDILSVRVGEPLLPPSNDSADATDETAEETDNPTEAIDDVAEERRESSPRPTENDEIVTTAASIDAATMLDSANQALSKPAIAAYLSATYGDGIETATRPDKTKTGLLCADNHYSTIQIKDGERIARKKRLCFVYVYHDEDKNLLRILLKTTPAHAEMLRVKHPAIAPASFPRTTSEPWFDLTIDDTYTVGDVFDAIDGAKKRLDGDLAPLVRLIVESKITAAAANEPDPQVTWSTELLTKKSVAAYLASAFGDGVAVNSRPDKTATGLPLADTHYTNVEMVDGELQKRKKPLCFAYVYTSDTGVTVLLRTTAALLAPLMEKHPEVQPSPFPRTSSGQWFTLPTNADWAPRELYGAIVDAKIACDGGTPDKRLVRLADEIPADDVAPATAPESVPVIIKPSFRILTEPEASVDEPRASVSYREADKALSDADVKAMTGVAKRKCNPNDRGVINLEVLCRYFEPGESVTLNEIKVRVTGFNQGVTYLKVLTGNNMDRPLCVEADEFSPIAAKMILLAGGKIFVTRK